MKIQSLYILFLFPAVSLQTAKNTSEIMEFRNNSLSNFWEYEKRAEIPVEFPHENPNPSWGGAKRGSSLETANGE